MENLAESITAVSGHGKSSFPFVSMPSFEVLGGQARELTKNDIIMWVPFVTEVQRDEWSNFSLAENQWYYESVMILQTGIDNVNDTYTHDAEFRSFIWEENPDVAEAPHGQPSDIFAPLWESSPPPFSISSCNYNVLGDVEVNETIQDLMLFRDATVGKVSLSLDSVLEHYVDPEEATKYVHDDFSTSDAIYEHPHSKHLQPVFLHLKDKESEIVGFVLSVVTWDHFMADLLHEDVSGVVAVLKNNCDQAYTYELHGDTVGFFRSHMFQ